MSLYHHHPHLLPRPGRQLLQTPPLTASAGARKVVYCVTRAESEDFSASPPVHERLVGTPTESTHIWREYPGTLKGNKYGSGSGVDTNKMVGGQILAHIFSHTFCGLGFFFCSIPCQTCYINFAFLLQR